MATTIYYYLYIWYVLLSAARIAWRPEPGTLQL